jgi:hypothetical protein
MIHRTLLANRRSALNRRFLFEKRARLRRRRGNRLFKVAADVMVLEERCMLATEGIPMPASTVGSAAAVMFQNGVDTNVKTVIIYNNSDSFVFPILEGENSASKNLNVPQPIPRYDQSETSLNPIHIDGWNEEYRVYVGYSDGGTNYIGLAPHSSVTVPIPMAIWDSGRLNMVLDTQSTRDLFLQQVIPYTFFPSSNTYAESISGFQAPGNVQNAMMLLYHSGTALGITSDAASQLIEWTIRDPSIPEPEPISFDYDISYLDAMYLPVALEAVGGVNPQKKPTQFGYVGTTLPFDKFNTTVQSFVNGTLLNGYLGAGQGWPQYYLSNPMNPFDPNDLAKIPGGANVFAESTNASSYDVLHSNLTSSQMTKNLPSTNGNYAVDAIANLWFSWAKYYLKINPNAQGTVLKKLLTSPNLKTFDIKIDTSTPTDLTRANAFAQIVWDVMSEFTKVTGFGAPTDPAIPTSQLLKFILGDNVGDIPGLSDDQKQFWTNKVILLMRGVPNNSNPNLWYPAPGDPTTSGLAKYNLNPFVWLVHTPANWYGQRIYAYAYSVDDEFGNVLIPGSSSLIVTVAEPQPGQLLNPNPFDPKGGQTPKIVPASVSAAQAVPAGPAASSLLGTIPGPGLPSANRQTSTVKTSSSTTVISPSTAVISLRRANQQSRSPVLNKWELTGSTI